MAVDMFLELDGVKGESKDEDHKGKIDILSWNWVVTNTGDLHSGGGGGAGKADIGDIVVTKYLDLSTADLLKCCVSGKHIAKGKLIVRKAGSKALDYLVIELEEVMVTQVSPGGSAAGDRVTETLQLGFSKFTLTYKEQTEKGAGGPSATVGFNVSANKLS